MNWEQDEPVEAESTKIIWVAGVLLTVFASGIFYLLGIWLTPPTVVFPAPTPPFFPQPLTSNCTNSPCAVTISHGMYPTMVTCTGSGSGTITGFQEAK